jgi:hypothetical protein
MNSIGKEYKQIGGDYKVMHHTEYLETLVAQKKLVAASSEATITYHDPCYLGRHNGVYDAPRNLLHILGNATVELERNRENAFCCGAGGAQFWKEEEAGEERISDNRFREVQQTLASAEGEKVLAVGCPFCKSMLASTPRKGESDIVIKDVAELLLEGVRRKKGLASLPSPNEAVSNSVAMAATTVAVGDTIPVATSEGEATVPENLSVEPVPVVAPTPPVPAERKKWQPKAAVSTSVDQVVPAAEASSTSPASAPIASAAIANSIVPSTTAPATAGQAPERKKWQPKSTDPKVQDAAPAALPSEAAPAELPANAPATASAPERKKWQPKAAVSDKPVELAGGADASVPTHPPVTPAPPLAAATELPDGGPVAGPDSGPGPVRKKWNPRKNESD